MNAPAWYALSEGSITLDPLDCEQCAKHASQIRCATSMFVGSGSSPFYRSTFQEYNQGLALDDGISMTLASRR